MKTIEQNRGQLTQRIKDKSHELLGYEINQIELRLMPYIQYVMVNNQRINTSQINSGEREIVSKWRKAGHLEGGAMDMRITREFWDIMNEILFLGYVDLTE